MAVARARPSAGRTRAVRAAVYALGVMPGLWTLWLALTDGLGADPVKVLEHTLGLWSLRLLIAGLAIRPLKVFGGPDLMPYRRAIGLLAFAYALAHLLVYVWLDQALDLAAVVADILKRPYITIGMAAFVILVPLAITSNDASIRRMGSAAWARLHKWVYAAAALGALHFLMLVKTISVEALIYAALVGVLLAWRLWDATIGKQRRRARRATRSI